MVDACMYQRDTIHLPWTCSRATTSEIDGQRKNNGMRPYHHMHLSSNLVNRVFKYANKGYGIRILPSYLEALAKINPDELPKEKYTGTWKDEAQLHGKKQFSLEARIANAQEYFERIFEVYMRWSNNGRDLQPSYIRGVWNGTLLRPTGQGLPVFTHALLDTRDQLSSQPQPRSCLTGFELLYR